jgi:hypothetical protein
MSLIFRITSSGQDDEPVTDEDCSSDSENEEKKKEDDEESEDEVTRHSEVQVIFSPNIITVVLGRMYFDLPFCVKSVKRVKVGNPL